MELTELQAQVHNEYSGAVLKGPERDVYRAHMDAELAEIMRTNAERMIPFERRYPELKTDDYGRRRKQ